MTALAVALAGGYGVFLVYTALVLRWRGLGLGPAVGRSGGQRQRRAQEWLAQAGLDEVRPRQFAAAMGVMFLVATAVAFAVFGAVAPAVAVGLFAASFPAVSYRSRRRGRRDRAAEAWPHMIEEVALMCGSLGRSIPQALFEVGHRAPTDMRPAFEAAQREWLLTTDFGRTVSVLKARLADPTADTICETLLVAHEVGGSDVERRLAALVEDRTVDLHGRKDARAKQAGVRFARRFVLLVPVGMALCGLSIGDGRSAYESGKGQAAAVLGVLVVVACWAWSGRIMRLPEEERVFAEQVRSPSQVPVP